MKHKFFIFFATLFLISLTASKCRKEKTPANPLDQLPPETQTGAGTIGFLADGKPFTANYPKVYATYIFTTQDGYSLGINAKNGSEWNLGLLSDSLKIQEKNTYLLNNNVFTKNGAWGGYIVLPNEYFTKPYLQGELYISHLDSVKQIISGTFWFNAADTISNEKIQITDGRFDLHYTR